VLLASIRRLLATRRCAWVLAWALCLPLAQWASAVHVLQHLRSIAAEQNEKPTLANAACELCLVAAAIGSGPPAATPHVQALLSLPHASPDCPPFATRIAPPSRHYASRAPPLLHA
jgi:hypothetical protein